jgi:ATP-dependent helicase HrpA
MPVFHYPADLPISARREEIVAAIARHQVVVLCGETGSGKTTQLPKMCWEARGERQRGIIGCTQPRRVAATSIARRVAEETGFSFGREIGCKIRFQDQTGPETRVKFMTDGILLAEIQNDPRLRGYSTIILDEAHERSLNIDFLLGHLISILPERPDLHVVITSATIDTAAFSKAFGNAPVIEVSGRSYPVDIRHLPLAHWGENEDDDEDPGHVESAVAAAESCLDESDDGDVLVFLPTERDIREAIDLLDGRLRARAEVLALYGRLPAAEQQKVFHPGPRRRIIVATNVAETSVTIPRITHVVDSGLARMSRYNPRTRTKRLPIEAISRSSANQRAGRAGRVRPGVCIRLYDEKDFLSRDAYTTPEIQRANLAEVILRLKAFRLGEIETFPFIDPPAPAAIRAGHQLLHELGALGDTGDLTPLGRSLARLPVDPTLARMLVQAREENVLPELLVIASGMSVPDPRERPDDAREKAAAAHQAFAAPRSDFLSLLRIWMAMPPPGSGGSAMRKFCNKHYLSFARTREWRDLWRQLAESMDAADEIRPWNPGRRIDEDAVHRCILAGHLGHIARREERNLYKASGQRQVAVFPGSQLHEKPVKEKKPENGKPARQPEWIVAGEIVQTSRLFARMIAAIDAEWVIQLGPHLVQTKYGEPHWDEKAERVLCLERVLLHGLELRRRSIDFGKVDPEAATDLFIRGALLADDSPVTHGFRAHNQRLFHKMTTALGRLRGSRLFAVEEAIFHYYKSRLPAVSSTHDLNAWLRPRLKDHPDILKAREEDLEIGEEFAGAAALFPDRVPLANTVLPVDYHYRPGEERDGVTLRVPAPVAAHLEEGALLWMVPGLREDLLRHLLRALPKPLRKRLLPIEARAREIAGNFQPGAGDFLTQLAVYLRRCYDVEAGAADFSTTGLPDHLRPRLEIIDRKGKTLASGRDLAGLQQLVRANEIRPDNWENVARAFARPGLTEWSFGDVPLLVDIDRHDGMATHGHPGLLADEHGVTLMLFRTAIEADRASRPAIRRLAERALGKDIAWLAKELKSPRPPLARKPEPARAWGDALAALPALPSAGANGGDSREVPDLPSQALEHILAFALRLEPPRPLEETRFRDLCATATKSFARLAHRVKQLLAEIEENRQAYLRAGKRHPGWENDLARLVPSDLLLRVPHDWLPEIPRYLKALAIRSERASLQPARDQERARLIAPWVEAAVRVPEENREFYRWMLEEYRVSVFAQELGTRVPVSPKRLEKFLDGQV